METESKSLAELHITGMEVNYYVLCPRKLWWYSHGMGQESAGDNIGQDNVTLGQLLHQESYPGKTRKDILIDGLIRLDFTEDGAVHEIKKSKGGQKATLYQLLYYLYYLKHEKGIETTGVIDYPQQKRRETVTLTPGYEADIERILAGVQEVREQATPPDVPKPLSICKSCAYQDLCWG